MQSPPLSLTGGRGMGAPVRGPALVSGQGFGFRYDLDSTTGVISNRDHDLYGEELAGRVLVFTKPKGGMAASWALASLRDRGIAPLAIVFREASPIFAQGALFSGLPIMHMLEGDPCALIRTGDDVALYPTEGRIDIFR